MGWQARLSKENKSVFERTCNKCGNTGVKRTYIATDGIALETPLKTKCSCILRQEALAAKAAIEQPNAGSTGVS